MVSLRNLQPQTPSVTVSPLPSPAGSPAPRGFCPVTQKTHRATLRRFAATSTSISWTTWSGVFSRCTGRGESTAADVVQSEPVQFMRCGPWSVVRGRVGFSDLLVGSSFLEGAWFSLGIAAKEKGSKIRDLLEMQAQNPPENPSAHPLRQNPSKKSKRAIRHGMKL